MKTLASVAVSAALCTLASSSYAQETKFGDAGTLVIHAATGSPMLATDTTGLALGATPTLGFQTNRYARPRECRGGPGNPCTESTTSYTSFYFNPRIHYFVIKNLSIGGEVLFAKFSGSRTVVTEDARGRIEVNEDIREAPTAFGLMPLIGYNIALSDAFSLWPHGGIGFRRVSSSDEGAPGPADDRDYVSTWWFANVDLPFMLHIAPHFALGAGPGATVSLSQSISATAGGVEVTQSGYSTTSLRWFNAHLLGYF